MSPSKTLRDRCVEPGASFNRKKQVFLVGFSLPYPRFPRTSKGRPNTSQLWQFRRSLHISNGRVL